MIIMLGGYELIVLLSILLLAGLNLAFAVGAWAWARWRESYAEQYRFAMIFCSLYVAAVLAALGNVLFYLGVF